jgi:hypothetical protein
MTISYAQLPSFVNLLHDKPQQWLGYDSRIEQLSVYDLHFFETAQRAADFQLFNHGQDKEVTLLPVDAFLHYTETTAKDLLKEGKQFSHIEIDDEKVLGLYSDLQFNLAKGEIEELMDMHDWNHVFYDPLEANTEAESFEDKLGFIRLEYLVEQLSSLSQSGERGMEAAAAIAGRYWNGTPMETQISDVLRGKYALPNELLFHHKNNVMNAENLSYLQGQLEGLGFGEGLHKQLEKNVKDGLPDFQLKASHEFNKDPMAATLHFKKSEREGKEMYFFNRYDASVKVNGREQSQTFYINNKGQSVTFKEAYNLMNGRSVFKELAPQEGEKYKAWVKLDFANRDENGNAKMKQFHENYGFDVKEALGRLPFKELSDPDRMQSLEKSLKKGNLAPVTLLKDGAEKSVQITADPQFKTLKMYDMDGKKLYVPAEKTDLRYGTAAADSNKLEVSLQENVGEKMDAKKTDLLPQNDAVKEGMGVKM